MDKRLDDMRKTKHVASGDAVRRPVLDYDEEGPRLEGNATDAEGVGAARLPRRPPFSGVSTWRAR